MNESPSMYTRPDASEYPSFYGGYVNSVPGDDDILRQLRELGDRFVLEARAIDESRGGDRYAPGKWTIRQVLGHVADTEQVMGFRALHFARSDPNALPGFAQDEYVRQAGFDEGTLAIQRDRFAAARESSILLFASLDAERMMRRGTASGGEFTVRSLAWILAGHAQHHLDVLRERYLA